MSHTCEVIISILLLTFISYGPGTITYFALKAYNKKNKAEERAWHTLVSFLLIPVIIVVTMATSSIFIEKDKVSVAYDISINEDTGYSEIEYKSVEYVHVIYETPDGTKEEELLFHFDDFEKSKNGKDQVIITRTRPKNKLAKYLFPYEDEYTYSLTEETFNQFFENATKE